jgi:beta-galactosidase
MNLGRVGFEFAVDEKFAKFNYVGYGPHESYIDKRTCCTNDYFESDAKSNYVNYVMPQETGSHYGTSMLNIENLFTVTAEKPFSFSVLPYTSRELNDAKHHFELKQKGITNVCLDVAMRGIGSGACGPALDQRFEIPREDENTFTLNF